MGRLSAVADWAVYDLHIIGCFYAGTSVTAMDARGHTFRVPRIPVPCKVVCNVGEDLPSGGRRLVASVFGLLVFD